MKHTLLLMLSLIFFNLMFSQGVMKTRKWRNTELDSLSKAQVLFEEGNYVMALPLYDQMLENHPKEMYLKYVTGICGLYRSDMHEHALDLLLEVYEKNKKAADIRYDLARAYHFNYKFDEAIALLDAYKLEKKISEEKKQLADQLMSYCNNGKLLVSSPVEAQIENAGEILNTVSSEYVPVVSSDEQVMIFTYRGDESTGGKQNAYNQPDELGIFYEDVFITHKENNSWITPESIGENINTNIHDAAIAISNDGQKLFIFRDNGFDGGDIYLSLLEGSKWSAPEKLQGEVNTPSWEGSASLSADERTLYFSSEKPGGFGGKDLYKASLMPDGTWRNIVNLGDKINTALDDDAPFIHPDGKTMLYSSKGHKSMGGYDIFKTEFDKNDSTWSAPENIGYPVNTPDDDIYFVLAADGSKGYYASGKSGGYGLHDIYVVDVSTIFKSPAVYMLSGISTEDQKPVSVRIRVENVDEKSIYREFNSNSVNGSYLVNLPVGSKYTVSYQLDKYPVQVINLDAKALSGFTEKKVDINFYIPKDSSVVSDSLLEKVDLAAAPKVAVATGNEGDISKEGLEFKVQIAAFSLPKNYKYAHLKNLGKVEKLLLEDGITRFTIGGSFKTFNEAAEHKNKVRTAGQKDAFVTAVYKGKRVYMEELEKMGLIPSQAK